MTYRLDKTELYSLNYFLLPDNSRLYFTQLVTHGSGYAWTNFDQYEQANKPFIIHGRRFKVLLFIIQEVHYVLNHPLPSTVFCVTDEFCNRLD